MPAPLFEIEQISGAALAVPEGPSRQLALITVTGIYADCIFEICMDFASFHV
jgi:hypothetical protein